MSDLDQEISEHYHLLWRMSLEARHLKNALLQIYSSLPQDSEVARDILAAGQACNYILAHLEDREKAVAKKLPPDQDRVIH
jgi:hypothetical protein